MTTFLNTNTLPFCKGCGHDLIARNTAKAVENLGIDILDIIAVTDIGCHGIIDKALNCHTVHGLHGRSSALGAGITIGLNDPSKKVLVFVGDGGATIGLQHIMEAARLNLNMTVIVHNNFLYGMTGGQSSGLTPTGFATTTSADGNPFTGYDLCAMVHAAGANYVSRIIGIGDISPTIQKALTIKGFSMVEVMEICPSYGVKLNPKRKFAEIVEASGKPLGEWTRDRLPFEFPKSRKTTDLFEKLAKVNIANTSKLNKPVSIVLSGSAGEGVQLAAGTLTKAALREGLEITQKGSYPVTVGVGFSTAEINLSPSEINFHGIDIPDYAVITSTDGLAHSRKRIEAMTSGILFIDKSLPIPNTGAKVEVVDFRSIGARDSSLYSIFVFAKLTNLVSVDSLVATIVDEGKADKLPLEKILKALESL
ncbi:MAG TPA: thiamine pyrophosphate-dependent enzyme [Salinivirgaceae bacterium]|nr:thiamine pyrophosphate-dependent enzyme [Salinivirgaceae bacterium]